jgi:GH15 family glucan-1,4-alpha-glucosidase
LLIEQSIVGGGFVKSLGSQAVDSSLLGLATPYRVVDPDHPRLQTTVVRIEQELMNGGGLHRYASDTYYGVIFPRFARWVGWVDHATAVQGCGGYG